jgi:putative ABC transport system permease protein
LEFHSISHPDILLSILGIAAIVGLLSGIYPAFFLSSFKPSAVLQGRPNINMRGGVFRSGMVVFQFVISIIIVLGTLVIYRQLFYIQNASLGFDKEQIVVVHRANALQHQLEAFRQELLQHTDISCISFSGTLPGRHFDANGHRLEGVPLSEETILFTGYVDSDFDELLNLEIIQGRFFSDDISTDVSSSVVINESAAENLGLDDAVGKRFRKEFGGAKEGEFVTIIGVVKDFHFQSLHQKIQPMILRPLSEDETKFASIKIRGGRIRPTLRFIEKKWNELTGQQPFKYSFLEDDMNSLYKTELKLEKLFTLFSILSIFIACLGLFALACYTSARRSKEIGIRKIHGASVVCIIRLVTKDFTKCVIMAIVIACPIAWYVLNQWLQNFAVRITISWWIFVLTGMLALVVALLTVSYQAVKAALANPIDSLKYE